MRNPWLDLPTSAPFILPQDAEAFAQQGVGRLFSAFATDLLPEPYFGRPDAPVVLLTLNPGYSDCDAEFHSSDWFQAAARASLAHAPKPGPFLHLLPEPRTPGVDWWMQRTKELREHLGSTELVASGLLCLQFIGYKSKSLRGRLRSVNLPSQEYTFELLRRALARDAIICVMRSQSLWESAVPELAQYRYKVVARNPRSPYITSGNLGAEQFVAVCERLTSSDGKGSS